MRFSGSALLACLLGLLAPPVSGQTRVVQGVIRDSLTGTPVGGAEVLVRATHIRAVSNASGEVTIPVPDGAVPLIVRAIGYRHRDLTLGANETAFSTVLVRDVFKIDELVVTGQATGIERRNLANAVATIGVEDLNQHPTASIEQQLQGKVAGAEITSNSGAPGGGVQVRLRGITSINATAAPLWVVDGVIVSDVAIANNMNVISNAAGASSSNLTQDVLVNRISDLNPAEIESIEILKGASAAAQYGGRASNGVIVVTTKRGKAGTTQINASQRFGVSTTARLLGSRRFNDAADVDAAFGAGTAAKYNFQPGVFYDNERFLADQRSLAHQTSIDVSGGTDATRYFASGDVETTPGIVRSTYFDRQSIRLNLDQRLGSKVTASLRTNVLHTKSDRGLTNNDNTGTSYYIAFTSTPSFIDLRQKPDGTFPVNPFAASNPLQTAALLQNVEDVWRLITGSTIEYRAFTTAKSSLRILATGGIDYFTQKNKIFSPPELQFEPGDGEAGTSLLSNSGNLNLNLDANAVHTYSGGGFNATTSVGAQYARRDLDIDRIESRGLTAGQSNVDAGTAIVVRQNRSLINTLGFFGQEEVLLLDNKLLLTAGIRADQSSVNADASKLFFYPKAAASYRINRAEGLLNEIKFRAAYGQSGNEPLYGQRFTPLLSTSNVGGSPGLIVGGTTANKNLQSERQREIEAGIDGQLANSRISFEWTVYQKTITDLLLTRALPPSSGFGIEIFNGGELRTRGIELGVGVVPFQTRTTNWYLRGSFSKYRSTITQLPVPTFQTGGFGLTLGSFQIEQGKSATQIVGNVNGGKAQAVLGDATPDYKVSFINDLSWKRWNLHATLDWSQGGNAINLTQALYDIGQVSPDYIPTGRARVISAFVDGNTGYIESATFVKLRELAVSYDLPRSVVQHLWNARGGRVAISARNLISSYPYKGLDPEVSNFGNQAVARNVDVAPYPPSRSFFFTFNIDF